MKTQGTSLVRRIPFLLLLCGAVVFSNFQSFGEEWSASQKEIWSLEENIWKLWKDGDMEARKELYHKDSVLWYSGGILPLGSDVITRWGSMIDSFDLEPLRINIFDNVAIVNYRSKWVSLGGADYYARITRIWMNQNGKWKIIGLVSVDCSKTPRCP
jgi:hypothetical protein